MRSRPFRGGSAWFSGRDSCRRASGAAVLQGDGAPRADEGVPGEREGETEPGRRASPENAGRFTGFSRRFTAFRREIGRKSLKIEAFARFFWRVFSGSW